MAKISPSLLTRRCVTVYDRYVRIDILWYK